MRLFIGIPLDNKSQEKLTAVYGELEGLKTVKKENLHITLQFLGGQDEQFLDIIKAAIDRACEGFRCFDIVSKRISGFPAAGSARVVWANIEEGAGPVKKLHALLEKQLLAVNYDREKRAYIPHITLARSKQPSDISAAAARIRFEAGSKARSCVLYSSELSAAGPVYTKMHERKFEVNGN